MSSTKIKNVTYSFGVAVGLTLLLLIILYNPFLNFSWENQLLHTFVESIEGIAAIVVAMILLQRVEQVDKGKNFMMALAFISMGILGLLHGLAFPGHGFVFLYCTMNIVSSVFFAMIILPGFGKYLSARRWILWLTTLVTLLLGLWVFFLPETIPARMVNNEFTPFAIVLNLLAGGFFTIAGVRIFVDFLRSNKKETLFFALFLLLSALSSFTFKFSSVWDGYWWMWHFIRFIAFLFIILILGRDYLIIVSGLKLLLNERIQAENELSQSEEKYRLMFENILNGFAYHKIVTNENGEPIDYTFVEINNGFEKLTGFKRDAIIGKNVTEIFPGIEKDPADWIGRYGNVALKGKDIQFESFSESIDKWYSIYAYCPKPGYFATIFEDISDRKQAEKTQQVLYNIGNAVNITDSLEGLIRLIQEELGKIIDTSNFYIALIDEETSEITFPYYDNEKEKFARPPKGKSLTHYVIKTEKTLLATIDVKKRLVEEGKLEYVGSLSKVWLGVPLKVENKITGVIAVQSYSNEHAFDKFGVELLEFVSSQIGVIIDRKRAEQELQIQNTEYESLNEEYRTQNDLLTEAVIKAEESDRLKSAFLANMSHEIRTPMNGILGFSELLKEPGLSGEEKNNYISIIEKSGERMLNTINDLIEISKLEAGQVYVSLSEVNVKEQLQYIYDFFKLEIENNGLQFSYSDIIPESELIINTDGEKLYGILTNLVKNAIKYTNAGSVDFGCQKRENFVEFYVKDTGIGIPKDKQESIFERFIQVDMSKSRTFEGSGLGLSITKANVELLGGELWLESEDGKGSVFYFTIPV